MGNQASVDPVHARIYWNAIQIQDGRKRCHIIQTCLAAPDYVISAKRAGVYSYLLQYLSVVQSGGTPPLLPGEQGKQQTTAQYHVPQHAQHAQHATSQAIVTSTPLSSWKIVAETPKQKAISYFASCLEVLNIQEEVALTEEALKSAYKKAALRAHPDKGGTEERFEAVTRAYAYLSDILKYMKGSKRDTTGQVDANYAHQSREKDARQWEFKGEPVRLDAKNLNMDRFNRLFEETHMPDPDSDGYGDWLKGTDNSPAQGQKFKGAFNRDVFNRAFEEDARKSAVQTQMIVHPGQMALTLNPTSGTELVGERPDSFTAAPNSKFQFTDLRGAYTSESTVSDKVANVTVQDRNFEQYRASRERAPDPFTQTELHGIREFEQRQSAADAMRERRRAEMHERNAQYHGRMQQMVITDNASNLNQKQIGYS